MIQELMTLLIQRYGKTDDLIETNNNKTYYTIEDLVTLYYTADKKAKELSNLKLDIEALKIKIYNLEQKVNNATLYIEEIDKHKKSIFEFWKFANKDELKALEVGNSQENESKKQIKKVFKYEFDFENLAYDADKTQRIKLSKIELDSAYILTTDIINVVNDISLAEKSLEELKQEQLDSIETYNLQEFDIFGNIQDNRYSIKNLGNQKHRESKKDKFKILGITKNTTLDEYVNKIDEIKKNLDESFKKIKSKYNMSIYAIKSKNNTIENEYGKYYINLEHALKQANIDEKEVEVYKINLKENMSLIYCSNIIFYDNFNKTLPEGINVEETVLLKNDLYEFEQVKTDEFKTNMYIDETEENASPRKIEVHEYNVSIKKQAEPKQWLRFKIK